MMRLRIEGEFRFGSLKPLENAWVLRDDALVLADLVLSKRTEIAKHSGMECDVVVGPRKRHVLYGDSSLRLLDLETGRVGLLVSADDPRVKHPTPEPVLAGARGAGFLWHLFLDGTGKEAVAYWCPAKSSVSGPLVVVISLTGEFGVRDVHSFEAPWSEYGMAVDFENRRVCLPMSPGGPRIVDLDGAELSRATSLAPPNRFCTRAVFAPEDIVAIGATDGLFLWNLFDDRVRCVEEGPAFAPAWRPGTREIWYSRGTTELWRLDLRAGKRSRVLSVGESPQPGAAATAPVFSDDGQFALVQLEAASDRAWAPISMVLDLEANLVHPPLTADADPAGLRAWRSAAWLGGTE